MFLFSRLITSAYFMSISWLVLELWQFLIIKDWPEMWKMEIRLSEFCPISGDWGKSGIRNLVQMSLIKCCWILQNSRVTAFTISELLTENLNGEGERVKLPPPIQIRVIQSLSLYSSCFVLFCFFFKILIL